MACEIVLENYTRPYHPGDVVTGKIIYEFNTTEHVEAIAMHFKGEEHTEWAVNERTEGSQTIYPETSYVNELYSGRNIFLNAQYVLAETRNFEPGTYEFPFSETLPLTAPGSYHGPFGSVDYSIEVITSYTRSVDKKLKIFNVIAQVDMREYPFEHWNPCTQSDERDTSADNCCGVEGPATMSVQLDKQIFLIGETIFVHVDIHNGSSVNIHKVNVELVKLVQKTATNPTRKIKRSWERLANVVGSGVASYRDSSFDVPLVISNTLMVYNFNMCSLFQQIFLIKVEAIFQEGDEKMLVKIPISIGNTDSGSESGNRPLLNDVAVGFAVPGGGVYPPPRLQNPPSIPIPSAPSNSGNIDAPEYTPPPSYNDAMKNSQFPPQS